MTEVPASAPLAMAFAEECDQGKVREENQDSVRHFSTPLGELIVVADGIGGYMGGATASRIVVEEFQEYLGGLQPDYPPDRAIREAAARANEHIREEARSPDSNFRRMGSTVVAALLQQDVNGTHAGIRAWIGHIGDSRAYLLRAGQVSRITNDHSAVQALLNQNLITPEEARRHPDASVLTRSLGHNPEVEIDIEMVPLMAGDTLLLCSDGMWGSVAEEEIERVMADPGLSIGEAARELLEMALSAGGHDNIGIEMARLSAQPLAVRGEIMRPRRRGLLRMLTVCVLAIAALGALAYLGYTHHWLQALHHLR
jgi:PPM family protein phosphatase